MIPRGTENMITALLREELERRSVKAQAFVSLNTPAGRREVDIYCRDGGVYLIEAKFREADLWKAVGKIQNDYIRYHRDLGINGGFAVLYPEELSRPLRPEEVRRLARELKFKMVTVFLPEDVRRNFHVVEGSLEEIADKLAKYILTPPSYVEPSIEWIIRTLRDVAHALTVSLRHLTGRQLEDLFGGRHVFRNILQYEEGKYPVEDLRLASAYLLVNQLLFYHVLSKRRPEQFEEIDPDRLRAPRDLSKYFSRVLDVNYRAVFSYDVSSMIPQGFLPELKVMVGTIQAISPEKIGGDLLGTIFHDLIPFETRKTVAAFYTNVLAAELLAWLSIDKHDAKVADLACGSGGLLVAAYRRKKWLLTREKEFTEEDHKRFVEEDLLGIDIMPFAANIAACQLSLQSPEYFTDKVNIAVWDSTELKPGDRIPSIAGVKILKVQTKLEEIASEIGFKPEDAEKGVVSLSGEASEEIKLGKYDVILMNPPFTRQERIPRYYKSVLNERFREYEDYLHGQLGYFGYFMFLSDRFIKKGGRMALVLPATVLRIRSCEGLRKLLAEHYHVEHIITTWSRSAFSESVRFREILLIARKRKPPKNAKTVITTLKKLPYSPEEAREIANLIKQVKKSFQDDKIAVKVYPYEKFRVNTKNWFKWISLSDLSLLNTMEELLSSEKLVPMSVITDAKETDLRHFKFKNFHGFILNCSLRVRKKNDIWVVDKVKEDNLVAKHASLEWKVNIPLRVLGRGLRRLSYVKTVDVSETADYLILSWFNDIKELARLQLTSKNLKQFNNSIVEKWRENFEARKCYVILGRRYDISAPGTSFIAFYSKYPVVGVDFWSLNGIRGDDAKILALWLNSTLNILQTLVLRTETRGAWMKIHNYMLEELLVPRFDKLSKSDRNELLDVFEQVKSVEFPSILEQLRSSHPLRRRIDEVWLRILGYSGRVDRLLDGLYRSLAGEILLLKKMMSEKS